MAVEQLAARLDGRLHLLTGGGHTAPPRQQGKLVARGYAHMSGASASAGVVA
jgi:hypothetical protein